MTDADKNTPAGIIGDDLAFFGAITASVTHELNNVLSIIDQNAGLMEDLLVGVQRGRPLSEEKVQRIASKITKQTARGFEFIRNLNKFAHLTDEPTLEFEVRAVVENLGYLVNRYCVLKRVDFNQELENDESVIVSSPFQLQQALYLVVRSLLSLSETDDNLTLKFLREGDEVQIEINFSKPADDLLANLKSGVEQYLNLSDWRISINQSAECATFRLVHDSPKR